MGGDVETESSSRSPPQQEQQDTAPRAASATPSAPASGRVRRRNGKKRAKGSQAKRRMENMTAGVDYKLVGSFSVILVLYALITLATWMRIQSQTISSPVINAVSPVRHREAPKKIIPTVRLEDIHDIETLQHTFPLHVGEDMEFIPHPGMLLASQEKMEKTLQAHPDLPKDKMMKVPKFWNPVAYGPGGVREFLGENGQRLMTPEEAKQIGSWDPVTSLETIFVSIASYRDPECQPTLRDLFLRAEHPERLRVAIIDQRANNDPVPPCNQPTSPCSVDPSQAVCMYSHLIDVYEVYAPLSIGPVFARHLANRMYRGEYFAMQVDSHVRFIENWDSEIVSQWKSAKNEMAVLSVYLSDLNDSIDPITHENTRPARPIMCKTDYESEGKMKHLRHGQQPEGKPQIHGEPTLHPFWAAGFSFARGHFVVQVPYDQYQPMVFQGEEIFQGLRGFTYGYDYYAPEISVAFHMYAMKKYKDRRKSIKLFWENQNLYAGSAVKGMQRLNGIIGMGDDEDKDTYFKTDEHLYSLGHARTKEKFFRLYGIHTETKTVENHLCTFVGKPMMKTFKPHLRKNGMGINFDEFDFEFVDPRPGEK